MTCPQADETVTISCAEHEALWAAAKALKGLDNVNYLSPYDTTHSKSANNAREALSALSAADIQIE